MEPSGIATASFLIVAARTAVAAVATTCDAAPDASACASARRGVMALAQFWDAIGL